MESRQIGERAAYIHGITYISYCLGLRIVNFEPMSLEELRKHLELIEREFVERFWFTKYRKAADKDWLYRQLMIENLKESEHK